MAQQGLHLIDALRMARHDQPVRAIQIPLHIPLRHGLQPQGFLAFTAAGQQAHRALQC